MSEGPGGPQGATAGGTLAMRMQSQRAMVASQMKRAANDKAIAQMLASKKSGPPAARLGDEIQHKSFLGALAGAVLGAIVTIAEGCLIMAACATGPYALVLVPALMYASYKASDYVEEKQNQLESWINSFCDTDGAINTGSENVNINGKPAARAAVTLPPPPPPGAIPEVPQGEPSWGDIATDLLESAAEKAVPLAKAWGNAVITLTDSNAGFMDRLCAGTSLLFPYGPVLMEFATMVGGRGEIKKDVDFPEAGEDTALCDKENKPPRIAQGSSNVFINNQPAARKGDKLECSAAIVGGSPDVFIGGEQVTYLDIQPEFPPWQRMILGGITIASYLLPPAGLLGKLKNLARLGKLGNLLGKSGKLLGAKLGALSQLLYVVLGLVGVPIFAAGGGFGYIFNPTFGFLLGLIPTAWVIGKIAEKDRSVPRLLLACFAGLAVLYLVGLPYIALIVNVYKGGNVSGMTLATAYMLPYLPGDCLKIVVSVILAPRILKAMERNS